MPYTNSFTRILDCKSDHPYEEDSSFPAYSVARHTRRDVGRSTIDLGNPAEVHQHFFYFQNARCGREVRGGLAPAGYFSTARAWQPPRVLERGPASHRIGRVFAREVDSAGPSSGRRRWLEDARSLGEVHVERHDSSFMGSSILRKDTNGRRCTECVCSETSDQRTTGRGPTAMRPARRSLSGHPRPTPGKTNACS